MIVVEDTVIKHISANGYQPRNVEIVQVSIQARYKDFPNGVKVLIENITQAVRRNKLHLKEEVSVSLVNPTPLLTKRSIRMRMDMGREVGCSIMMVRGMEVGFVLTQAIASTVTLLAENSFIAR